MMIKKIAKDFRGKWHGALLDQGKKLSRQNDLLNKKIMFIMKQLSPNMENELPLLFDLYGSDKGSSWNNSVHTYAATYQSIFSPIRNEVKAVFECGIFGGA
jgi:hypothetical protein